MAQSYLRRNYNRKETPQSESIPGTNQTKNDAGGFAWAVDDWKRLDRFLVLGSEGGTYYVSEQKLTRDNAEAVERCIKTDGVRVVNRIVEVSELGRAPKNDPALFCLAMCASIGDDKTRKLALESLPKVARIGTHLFHFVSFVESMRGWGRGLKTAIGNWYNEKEPDKLAFQVVKYQQRDKWSHADLLRLSHPTPSSPAHNRIYKWIVDSEVTGELPSIISGLEEVKNPALDLGDVVKLIKKYSLTIEMIPTNYFTSPTIQEALLPNLGYTALIRNLGNFSKGGLLGKGKWKVTEQVVSRIVDPESIKKSRVHPIGILTALLTYSSGKGVRGRGEWEVSQDIVEALDHAFYSSFGNVTPTGKRLVLAIDVSGSMEGGDVAGVAGLTPRLAAAAMSMVTYKVEKKVAFVAFSHVMAELNIGRYSRLKEVERAIDDTNFGNTDCALPMLWAIQNKVEADAFIIYTDSQTWYGNIHPSQALSKYRRQFNIPAKLIVVGMTSEGFSIADPEDSGMLDVVGFDTATPEVMSQFILE